MSTLGHVLFLLPFLRDFTHSACIASFLTLVERTRRRIVTGEIARRESSCSPQPLAAPPLEGGPCLKAGAVKCAPRLAYRPRPGLAGRELISAQRAARYGCHP